MALAPLEPLSAAHTGRWQEQKGRRMRAAFAVVAGVLAVDPVATESSATELARLTASHPVHMENFASEFAGEADRILHSRQETTQISAG